MTSPRLDPQPIRFAALRVNQQRTLIRRGKITGGFVYVAVILDAWSRRVLGYAIGRSIDVRLTLAALRSAIEQRRPPPGCVHHGDRGSQYAAGLYRQALVDHVLTGSMGRRGNPYDNAKAKELHDPKGRASEDTLGRGGLPDGL